MRRDTHGGGSRGDCRPFDSPRSGACPTTPQTASRVTAARAAPPWPIKTQLSGPDSIPTQGDWVWLRGRSECRGVCVCVYMLGVFLQSLVDEWTPSLSLASLFAQSVCVHSSVIRCAWSPHVHARFETSTHRNVCSERSVYACANVLCEVLCRQAVLGYAQTDL